MFIVFILLSIVFGGVVKWINFKILMLVILGDIYL